MIRWLHPLIDVMGTLWLFLAVLGLAFWIELARQEWAARRRRPRIEAAPRETPIPPWQLSKADLQLWLEARAAEAQHHDAMEEDSE
jgi:hypothetical protein